MKVAAILTLLFSISCCRPQLHHDDVEIFKPTKKYLVLSNDHLHADGILSDSLLIPEIEKEFLQNSAWFRKDVDKLWYCANCQAYHWTRN